MGRLLVFGTSHAVAPARLRDGLYMDDEAVVTLLGRLIERPEMQEAALLHTCTRIEVYALASDSDAAEATITDYLAEGDHIRRDEIERHSYAFTERSAARHLLRVAAGLDSIVLGEPQILGQVREAGRLAADIDATGPILRRLFAAGVRAGKRARAETRLAQGPTSLAAAGVRLALDASNDFPSETVLVVGAGETAQLTARHLAKRRPGRLVIANRSAEPAERLAAELDGVAASLDEVPQLLSETTVVITATTSPEPIVRARDLVAAMESRTAGSLVIVDLGRPRNVAPPEEPIAGLSLHDLDGLAETVRRNRDRQVAEIPSVEAIVDEELERFLAWKRGRGVVPHLRALRRHFFELGRSEMESHVSSFDEEQRVALEEFTDRLIAKLLHEPTVRIKQTDLDTAEGVAQLEAVESLFDLDV